jgi:hypothetical protein
MADRPAAWRTTAGVVSLAMVLAAPEAWSVSAPTRAPIVQAVIDCRTITEPTARLACYDKAVDGMAQADAKGDLVTIDREQRQTVRRQAFGLTLPALSMFDRGKAENVDRITATVSAAARGADGKWLITLDDGALWRQTDDQELYPAPRAGAQVTVRKGALGSFFMDIGRDKAIRVHRQN